MLLKDAVYSVSNENTHLSSEPNEKSRIGNDNVAKVTAGQRDVLASDKPIINAFIKFLKHLSGKRNMKWKSVKNKPETEIR